MNVMAIKDGRSISQKKLGEMGYLELGALPDSDCILGSLEVESDETSLD